MKQGEKLMLLVKRDRRKSTVIAKAMGVDISYLPKLFKRDILPPKPLKKAQEVFGVPLSYFLDDSEALSLVEDAPAKSYHTGTPEAIIARLEGEISSLKAEISRLNKMLEQEKSTNSILSEAILNMSKKMD